MRVVSTFFLIIVSLAYSFGQTFLYEAKNNIPVSNTNGILASAWAGGLNSATFSSFDFDLDGHKDLLVFDRQQNRPLVFLTKQNTYQFAPELSSLLPPLNRYALFYDFDNDNKDDLFTATPIGMRVYKNVSSGNTIEFQLYMDPILTRYYSKVPINMSLTVLDIPFLWDMDKDGDMDVLHFNSQTGENALLETNFSMEKFGRSDSLYFGTTNEKWGGFDEIGCSSYLFGNNGTVSYNYRLEHIGAGAVVVFDADNNGFPDLLVGKQDCQTLNFLKNNASGTTTFFNKLVTHYPSASPIDSLYYPVPCLEDVDFDGVKDLLVSMGLDIPNPNSDLENTVWWYKNTGSNAIPNFQFRSQNYIQNTMIDHGQNSVPAFVDADGDGDLDLFVSNSTNLSTKASSIFYYQNTGTSLLPAFTLVDTNYFTLATKGFQNLFITFADLNQDNKTDLVYLGTNNYSYSVQIAFNQSATGLDLSPSVALAIPIQEPSSLCFYSLDGDSLIDVLVGDAEGNLMSYKNTGTKVLPSFTLLNENYGGLSTNNQNASATICDVDHDLLPDLVFLNDSGTAKLCLDFLHQDNFHFHYSFLQSGVNVPSLGQQLAMTSGDLDQDGYPELVVGNTTGGLSLLQFQSISSGVSNPFLGPATLNLHIWPNPTDGNFEIEIPESGVLKINDSMGRQLIESSENFDQSIKQTKLISGIYNATFWGQTGKKYSKKLIVR